MQKELQFLEEQDISPTLLAQVEAFREEYPVDKAALQRVNRPNIPFYGKEILEMAMAALLQGSNLLLSGAKATGKNILAENLAWIFGRPSYNISFNVNTDGSTLIGTDTFRNNQVELRKGSVYRCAEEGGFGIFDEINMAKNDAASVLHATLDHRRMIDVPGYERIDLHPATRFIGTMNYGYVGTGYDGNYQKDFYRFDPSAPSGGQWSIMNGYGGQKRMSGSAFVIDEKAYIFCGINNGSYPDDLYCYDPSTDTWTKKRDISDSSDDDYDDDYTSITRSGAVCMVIDGKMYLATGESGSLLSTYWVYDPETDLWNNDDFTLFEGSARTAAIGFSNGKRGFIVTGRSSSYYFDDNWELLPYEIEED